MFTQVAENLFTHEQELRFRFGLTLMTRMSIVRRGRDLWVHSPLPGTDWYESIHELGDVRFLVAPSCYHCSFIEAAKQRFPEAVLVAPPKLEQKLKAQLALTADSSNYEGWPADLIAIPVQGAPKISEHLFYDRQSRSLIVTDLIFHNERGRNWITRLLLGVFAPTGRPTRSKEWNWMLIKDREAFAQSLYILNTLPIDRIVGAHGHIIEDVPLALSLIQTGKPPACLNAIC